MTPPRWDEVHALGRATFYQREVAKIGGASFVLNLGPGVEKAARADKNGFTDHMRRRLARALKAAFGAPTPFWFAVDVTSEGRPHLQGTIAVPLSGRKKLAEALKRVGGQWGSSAGERFQVQLGDRLDDQWATYSTRENRPKWKQALKPTQRTKADPLITATNDIRRGAKASYNAIRNSVLDMQRNSGM